MPPRAPKKKGFFSGKQQMLMTKGDQVVGRKIFDSQCQKARLVTRWFRVETSRWDLSKIFSADYHWIKKYQRFPALFQFWFSAPHYLKIIATTVTFFFIPSVILLLNFLFFRNILRYLKNSRLIFAMWSKSQNNVPRIRRTLKWFFWK